MKKRIVTMWLSLMVLAYCPSTFTQGVSQSPSPEKQAAPPSATNTRETNVREYTELLHTDVRQQKPQIMGAMMQLDAEQAKKFWPIYNEYNAELSKLNKRGAADMQDYSRNYDQLTDSKADQIVQDTINYQKQRADLLAKYHARVKEALGAVEAARFLEIEMQLLNIIDLQMESSLPIRPGS
jgi:hypothetical protein